MNIDLTPIEDIKKIVENQQNSTSNVENVLATVYQDEFEKIKQDSEFQQRVNEVVAQQTATTLRKDLLTILSEEQKNELAQYELNCEKEKLEYRKKKEKKVVRAQVKADIQEKKINALKQRYGYLYKKDANGEPIDFVASNFVNKFHELGNWWNNTSTGFKKFVKGTVKILFYGAIAFLILFLGYKGIVWLMQNVNNFPLLNK